MSQMGEEQKEHYSEISTGVPEDNGGVITAPLHRVQMLRRMFKAPFVRAVVRYLFVPVADSKCNVIM